jgi:tyrosinase
MSLWSGSFSRRVLLKSGSGLGLIALTGCTRQEFDQAVNNRPVRRNVSNLAATDPILKTYAAAITKMKALPSSDPRNWTNQALIHFNHCPHNNWWLLPWHRWYLRYFEQICQNLTGDQSFMLPYWNWTLNPAVPNVFWDTSSPLYDSTRLITQGTPIEAEFVQPSTLETILEDTTFQAFGSYSATTQQGVGVGAGDLEAIPHNNVHNEVGGVHMGTFMSPLDPLFWMHHAMIDYCWVDWNLNRGNANPSDALWQNLNFTDFCDQTGSPVTAISGLSQLFPIFTYQYEPSQIGNTVATPVKFKSRRELDQLQAVVQQGASSELPVTARFPLEQRLEVSVKGPAATHIGVPPSVLRAALDGKSPGRVRLTLGNVVPPAKADFFVRVFVNAGTGVNAQTPISDPHYVGSVAFFVGQHGGQMESHEIGFTLDATQALRRLNQTSALSGDRIDISVVAVPYPGRTVEIPNFSLGRMELTINR